MYICIYIYIYIYTYIYIYIYIYLYHTQSIGNTTGAGGAATDAALLVSCDMGYRPGEHRWNCTKPQWSMPREQNRSMARSGQVATRL